MKLPLKKWKEDIEALEGKARREARSRESNPIFLYKG